MFPSTGLSSKGQGESGQLRLGLPGGGREPAPGGGPRAAQALNEQEVDIGPWSSTRGLG